MTIRGVHCIITLFLVAFVDALIKPVYEDDPELYKVWTTPGDEKLYDKFTPGATWVGNLYAGRAEFPFLVDIRVTDEDQETWSVGTLLAALYVLTTCRSVKRYRKINENHGAGAELTAEMMMDIKISYAPTYLWENYNTSYYKDYVPVEAEFAAEVRSKSYVDSGTRTVRKILIHPDCGVALSGDLAIIEMSREVYPIVPIINYLPILLARTGDAPDDPVVIADVNLAEQVEQRRVCYVASFGRDWVNWVNHIVIDYKVRYRVYYEKMETCNSAATKFQLDREQSFPKKATAYPPLLYDPTPNTNIAKDKDNTMCFITRARVGTVCDHDRGAPLVCEGYVHGFLVRGAHWLYCNNLMPMPFIVVKAKIASNYYDDAMYTLNTGRIRGYRSGSHSVLFNHQSFYLQTFFVITHLIKTKIFKQ